MGAAASRHDRGIAGYEPHFVGRNAQPIGEHLRERRLMSLPARLGASNRLDLAARLDSDPNIFAGMSDRRLHIVRHADTRELAALPRLAAASREAPPIGQPEGAVQVGA